MPGTNLPFTTQDENFTKPDLDFGTSNVPFAKIVSVPKPGSAWSQAYNAGKLFAVLSLEKDTINVESPDALNILGKDILGKLEEEFFTLDLKDSQSIKTALSKTFANIEKDIHYSFAASFFTNNTLYLFAIGKGTVFIRRNSKIAKFSVPLDENPKSIISCSGFLKNNDLIILTTNMLADIINNENLSSLDNFTAHEIAEALMPKIQEKEDGKTAVIIIRHSESKPPNDPKKIQEETLRVEKSFISLLRNYLPIKNIKFNHSSKVMLTVAFILLTIFIASVYFGIKKQESSKTTALFEKTYPEAQKKYSEGNSLLGLNKNVARENFVEAKKILEEAKPKFSKNSKEEKQVSDLLKKVQKAISVSSGVNLVDAKEVDIKESIFLSLQIKKPQNTQFAQDEKNVYLADNNSLYSVPKSRGEENEIIKNSNFWQKLTSLGAYLGNLYVLDKNPSTGSGHGQILKFAPGEGRYSKTNYLSQDLAPDFSKATSIAIDGSIYVLLSDGAIEKFTRGKQDRFAVYSLDKPFSSPSKIFTNIDTKSLYILDNGNSRIVVLNKEGVYQTQYQADVLKEAKDFEVKETDKKIFVLSENKIYEIEIK